MDATRRPNECPRCGFAYSALWQPKPPRRPGAFHSYKSTLTLPWQCRCGAWIRMRPWTFGWADLVTLFVIATIQLFVAVRFWWARTPIVFFIPIGVWFILRTSKQVVVEEVPAPDEASRAIG